MLLRNLSTLSCETLEASRSQSVSQSPFAVQPLLHSHTFLRRSVTSGYHTRVLPSFPFTPSRLSSVHSCLSVKVLPLPTHFLIHQSQYSEWSVLDPCSEAAAASVCHNSRTHYDRHLRHPPRRRLRGGHHRLLRRHSPRPHSSPSSTETQSFGTRQPARGQGSHGSRHRGSGQQSRPPANVDQH